MIRLIVQFRKTSPTPSCVLAGTWVQRNRPFPKSRAAPGSPFLCPSEFELRWVLCQSGRET